MHSPTRPWRALKQAYTQLLASLIRLAVRDRRFLWTKKHGVPESQVGCGKWAKQD
jgi:hypothetical protein